MSDWKQSALRNPNVQAWWSDMQRSHGDLRGVDMLDFMANDHSGYDYKKAIEAGAFPTWQTDHNQYRWSDMGKGITFQAPNESEETASVFQRLINTLLRNQ